MGMVSEIATANTIQTFVKKIKMELEENGDNPEVCAILKKIGRFALTRFEWNTPDWADEYRQLFDAPPVQ